MRFDGDDLACPLSQGQGHALAGAGVQDQGFTGHREGERQRRGGGLQRVLLADHRRHAAKHVAVDENRRGLRQFLLPQQAQAGCAAQHRGVDDLQPAEARGLGNDDLRTGKIKGLAQVLVLGERDLGLREHEAGDAGQAEQGAGANPALAAGQQRDR